MQGLIAMIVAAAASATGSAQAPTPVSHAPVVIRFARYREAGATVRKLILRTDGTLVIDDPSGGAGRRLSSGRVRPQQLRRLERLVTRAPLAHPSQRTTTLREVDPVAYWLIRRGHAVHTIQNRAVPTDLVPLIRRLNAIFDGGRVPLDSSYWVLS
jgi:hypothetical protein